MLSFDAEVADPCSGGARSPVRGHVPLRNVGVGVSGPPTSQLGKQVQERDTS